MDNKLRLETLNSYINSNSTNITITDEEKSAISSIWLACDTQDENGNAIKSGDGNLNQNELVRFKTKLIETSKKLFNIIQGFLKDIFNQDTENKMQKNVVVNEEDGTETYFDKYGNIERIVDNKKGTDYTYSTDWASGQISEEIDNKTGNKKSYTEYHNWQEASSYNNENNTETFYDYDENGKKYITSKLDHNTNITTYYDSEGNITGYQKEDNDTNSIISYDKNMQVTWSVSEENGIRIERRGNGTISTEEDNNKNLKRYYDLEGKLIKEEDNNYISEPNQNGKFSNETIANNMRILNSGYYIDGDQLEHYKEMLSKFNSDNILDILKSYEDLTDNSRLFSQMALNYGDQLKDELQEKANLLIQNAKNKNVYTKDYEKYINTAIKNNNMNELAIAMDRLTERIFKATDVNKTYRASQREKVNLKPNGKIDGDFAQGYTGDCWLISTLCAVKNNQKALDKLNNMLEVSYEADGETLKEITVNIKGNKYSISAEELNGAVELSTGDLDVRAIEIAVNRYRHENGLPDIADSGTPQEGFEILFGDDVVIEPLQPATDDVINQIKSGEVMCVAGAHIDNPTIEETGYKGTDKNGNEIPIYNGHAYNVVKADDNYVYLINPWDTETEIKITVQDFKDLFNANDSVGIMRFKN